MRSEVVDMHVAGPPVRVEFEMMMLDIREAVAHLYLAGMDLFRPKQFAAALDGYLARDGLKFRIDHEFRAERAVANFRAGEI